MKTLATAITLLTIGALTPALRSDPVYDTNLKMAPLLQDSERIILDQIMEGKHDDEFIIKSFVPRGVVIKEDDEITGAKGNRQEVENANRAIVDHVRKLLDGEVEFPIQTAVELVRYNLENETFITGCYLPSLLISNVFLSSEQTILSANNSTAISIKDWDFFSGVHIPAAQAPALLDLIKNHAPFSPDSRYKAPRFLFMTANCHLVAGTMKIANFGDGKGTPHADAIIDSYTLGLAYYDTNGNITVGGVAGLPALIADAIKPGPYTRTPTENAFVQIFDNKVLTGTYHTRTLVFHADGHYSDHCHGVGDLAPRQKIDTLAAELKPTGTWFIVQNKLLFISIDVPTYFDLQATPTTLKLGETTLALEPHIKFAGSRIGWVP